jgi:hypothetical protein
MGRNYWTAFEAESPLPGEITRGPPVDPIVGAPNNAIPCITYVTSLSRIGMSTKEEDLIESAYEDEVKGMFPVFYANLLLHGPDSAADIFKNGLAKLKAARQAAIKLVQDSAATGQDTPATSASILR